MEQGESLPLQLAAIYSNVDKTMLTDEATARHRPELRVNEVVAQFRDTLVEMTNIAVNRSEYFMSFNGRYIYPEVIVELNRRGFNADAMSVTWFK
jgi:hypothetical protein